MWIKKTLTKLTPPKIITFELSHWDNLFLSHNPRRVNLFFVSHNPHRVIVFHSST
jgi:hypothetical protein